MAHLNRVDADVVEQAVATLSLLPTPDAVALASALDCILHTPQPSQRQITEASAAVAVMRDRLRAESNPDRWLDEVVALNIEMDVVEALIAERAAQAKLLDATLSVLVDFRRPVPA